jgi:hypothetical protein
MNARLIPLAVLLFAVSATAHAQGKSGVHKGTKQEVRQAEATYQQCVYNQGGYVAQVRWFADGTMKSKKSGDTYTISATKPATKTETISLGQRSCVGGNKTSKNSAVLTIKGGKIARAVAIAAADVGAIGGTGACWVGVAALTAVTAGGAGIAGVGCEAVTDATIGLVADPSVIPDAKELFAVVQPPASNGLKPLMIVMYGTVFDPKTKTGRP